MEVKDFDQLPCGFSWVLREPMLRTSHALVDDGRVWLFEPTAVPEALARVAQLGEPVAVVQLLDRHNRDCAAVAARLGVPHLKVPDTIPDSPFEVFSMVDVPGWKERALWWPEHDLLFVPEAIGTGPYFRLGDEAAGIHPMLRAWPPGALRGRTPQHLLVGHGSGVHGEAAATAPDTALERSRRDIPRMLFKLPRMLLRR
jgi:hypothetical protein